MRRTYRRYRSELFVVQQQSQQQKEEQQQQQQQQQQQRQSNHPPDQIGGASPTVSRPRNKEAVGDDDKYICSRGTMPVIDTGGTDDQFESNNVVANLASSFSAVAMRSQSSKEIQSTSPSSWNEDDDDSKSVNGDDIELHSEIQQQQETGSPSAGYVAVQEFISNKYAPSYWYLFRKYMRIEFSLCCCKVCPCQCCRSPSMSPDEIETQHNNDECDIDERNNDVVGGNDNSPNDRGLHSKETSLRIMNDILTEPKLHVPFENAWVLHDRAKGLLWWIASMFCLYMTIVNIGGKFMLPY
jgi:type II secretory pathway pseudopilin PulG